MGRRKKSDGESDNARTAGFSVYIGPTIPGVITKGKLIRGSRDVALVDSELRLSISRNPRIAELIVDGIDLPESRIKVKTKGDALYKSYRALIQN